MLFFGTFYYGKYDVFLRREIKFCDNSMKEKILAALVAINGQYNLSKEALERIADTAVVESEDKIGSWVDSIKPLLGAMQSYADSRVTSKSKEVDALKQQLEALKKSTEKKDEGTDKDLDNRLGGLVEEKMKSILAQVEALSNSNKELQEKLKASESRDAEVRFAEVKKRVAGELGISDKVLGLLDGKLNASMDEAEINKVLSESKKVLVELGLPKVEDGQTQKNADAKIIEQRAEAYLKRFQQAKEDKTN